MPPENEPSQTESTTQEPQSTLPETSTPQSEAPEQQAQTEEGDFETPDFSDIFDSFEGDEPVVEPSSPPAAEETQETPPEETPAETPADAEQSEVPEETPEQKEEPKEEAPEKEETSEKKPEETSEPEPEPVKMPTAEELQGMYTEHRTKTLPELEKMFQLSEEDAAALNENPAKHLPKLAAKMQYDTMLSTYNALMAAMPSVVNRLISVSNDSASAEEKFFDMWPDLKEGRQVAEQAIRAFRSANPRADIETVMKQAGVMAMIQLGKDPQAAMRQGQQAPAGNVSAPAPTQQPTQQPAKAIPPKPVSPHGSTQTAPPSAKSDDDNVFGDLLDAFEQAHN